MKSFEKLITSGRLIVAIIASAIVMGLLSIVSPAGYAQSVFAAIALVLAGCGVLFLFVSWKRERAFDRSSVEDARRLNRELTRDVKALSSDIEGIKEHLAQQSTAIDLHAPLRNSDALGRNGLTELKKRELAFNLFAPKAVPAMRVLDKPNAQVAGRLAADQKMEFGSEEQLVRILDLPQHERDRVVLWIGSGVPGDTPGFDFRAVRCASGMGTPDAEAFALVLYLGNGPYGPWSGITSSHRTHEYKLLRNYVNAARDNGALVLYIKEDNPSHFSADLVGISDTIVTDEPENDTGGLELHRLLMSMTHTSA